MIINFLFTGECTSVRMRVRLMRVRMRACVPRTSYLVVHVYMYVYALVCTLMYLCMQMYVRPGMRVYLCVDVRVCSTKLCNEQ